VDATIQSLNVFRSVQELPYLLSRSQFARIRNEETQEIFYRPFELVYERLDVALRLSGVNKTVSSMSQML
jgi:hypothetical protein